MCTDLKCETQAGDLIANEAEEKSREIRKETDGKEMRILLLVCSLPECLPLKFIVHFIIILYKSKIFPFMLCFEKYKCVFLAQEFQFLHYYSNYIT